MAETGRDISRAAAILRKGGVVGIPTETVYGLAANALDAIACTHIFEVKERPHFDPLIVHISSINEVAKYAIEFPDLCRNLCEALWPGPLTVVLKKRNIVPDIVTAGQSTVALRVPGHKMTRELIDACGFPLAAPSANPFGYVSPTTAGHVNDQLGNKIPYILDGGPCQVGLESTIVRFTGDLPEVLRLGGTDITLLHSLIGEFREALHAGSDITSPGQLDSHYAPRTPFYLVDQMPAVTGKKNTGLLVFKSSDPVSDNVFVLAPDGNIETAATRLFGILRQMDAENFDEIYAEKVPDEGLGRAINDRLMRASVKGLSPE